MNDEIKEIDITKDLYLCSPLLNTKCPKTSCYINNGSCCHTVNKEYSQEHLLDYITNLQQKEELFEKIVYKYDELKQENERLKTKTKEQSLLLIDYQDMEQKLENYKSRIEKAVEFINKNKSTITQQRADFYNCDELRNGKLKAGTFMWCVDELLNILNGDNNE